VTWEVYRWLPKEERSIDYYVNEYRFVAGDSITPYAYSYTSDALYELTAFAKVELAGGLSKVSLATAAILASAALLSF